MHPKALTIGIVAWIVSATYGYVQAASDQQLLDILCKAHTAAVTSIIPFSCHIEVIQEPPPSSQPEKASGVRTADYWRSLDAVRIREVYPDGAIVDNLMKNSEVRWVQTHPANRKPGKTTTAGRRAANDGILGIGDADRWMLFTFPGRNTSRVNLSQFLELPFIQRRITKVKEDGREQILLDITRHDDPSDGEKEYRIWFDPELNDLARKMHILWFNVGKRHRVETEVLNYLEAAPAVFVPDQNRVKVFQDEKYTGGALVRISSIRVHQHIPPGQFELAIPPHVFFTDRIERKTYTTGSSGRPSGKFKKLEMDVSRPTTQLPAETQATQSEKQSLPALTWLIRVTGISLLAAAVVAWVARKRKNVSLG